MNNGILLINPPANENSEAISPKFMRDNYAFNYPPLGLLYLAANLPSRYECRIIDAPASRLTPSNCIEEINKFKPFLIGITAFSDSLYSVHELSKMIKEYDPNIIIVIGGPHVNIFPKETLTWGTVDYVLTGFCENTFANLAEILSSQEQTRMENIPGLWWREQDEIHKSLIDKDPSWNINEIEMPDRELLDNSKYFTLADQQTITTMISSRGCPFQCTFCDVFEKSFLTRSVDDLVKEIKHVLSLGIRQIHFFDDCFNLKRQRVIDLCRAFIENKLDFRWSFRGRLEPCDDELAQLLYKAGCRRAQIGIEASDQETIKMIRKGINLSKVPEKLRIYKKAGVRTMGYFILGYPHQRLKDCVESCKEIRKMGFDYINMFILIPYPNTEIYQNIFDDGMIKEDIWKLHAIDPQPNFKLPKWHPHVKRSELEALLVSCYNKFYFSPRFILMELRRVKSLRDLSAKVKQAVAMIIGNF